MGFPGGSPVKNVSARQEPQEAWVRSLGQEDPLEKGRGIQYSCLENSHGQGSLSGYSPYGQTQLKWLRARKHTQCV